MRKIQVFDMSLPGVYKTNKKDGSIYYRASITYKSKHISLGGFHSVVYANLAYEIATDVLRLNRYKIKDYMSKHYPLKQKTNGHDISLSSIEQNLNESLISIDKCIPFDKWITLHNFRDNGIYIKTPIYLKDRYFIYYLDQTILLKFDIDDLFFYAHHKIMKRGGYLFVSDYGMQINVLSRYGIRNFSVKGRDYRFINGDEFDFRYSNIEVINPYYGVQKSICNGKVIYTAKININGDYIIGRYPTEIEAAIAYNKAINCLKSKLSKDYIENYIHDIDDIEYAKIYNKIRISKKIRDYLN